MQKKPWYEPFTDRDIYKVKRRVKRFFSTYRNLFLNNSMTAEDLLQECYISILHVLDKYAGYKYEDMVKLMHKTIRYKLITLWRASGGVKKEKAKQVLKAYEKEIVSYADEVEDDNIEDQSEEEDIEESPKLNDKGEEKPKTKVVRKHRLRFPGQDKLIDMVNKDSHVDPLSVLYHPIEQILPTLGEIEQKIIEYRIVQGKSFRQIAKLTGLTKEGVRYIYYKTVDNLDLL